MRNSDKKSNQGDDSSSGSTQGTATQSFFSPIHQDIVKQVNAFFLEDSGTDTIGQLCTLLDEYMSLLKMRLENMKGDCPRALDQMPEIAEKTRHVMRTIAWISKLQELSGWARESAMAGGSSQ
jgi:hypothetical protein